MKKYMKGKGRKNEKRQVKSLEKKENKKETRVKGIWKTGKQPKGKRKSDKEKRKRKERKIRIEKEKHWVKKWLRTEGKETRKIK